MDEIIPNLWIGDLPSALAVEKLKANNVFSILTAMRGRITIHETFIRHQILLDDEPDADILMHFLPSINFIDEELNKGRGVLVHCQAGLSRSVTIVAAYLMWRAKGSMDVESVLNAIREKRPYIDPNEGFIIQLEIFYKAAFRISRKDKVTRMFYMERTVEEVMNGDGSPPSASMFAKFPRTPSDSAPGTPSPLRRRIRCKMCRQELATREHMLDHGQLGPATPSPMSPMNGSPGNSRRSSGRESTSQPTVMNPTSRNGSFSGQPMSRLSSSNGDTRPRRPSLLSFGGLSDTLAMSALDSSQPVEEEADDKHSGGESNPTPARPSNSTPQPRRASADPHPFGNMPRNILDNLSMSALDSSDESDFEAPSDGVERQSSMSRAAQLGRKMSDAVLATTSNSAPPTATEGPLTTTLTTMLNSSAPSSDVTLTESPSSQYATPQDLAAQLYANPKLAALRSPSLPSSPGGSLGSMAMTPMTSTNKVMSSMISPPILVNPKCSGYFVEPLAWMSPFLSNGEVAGKIVCPNKKCNAKLGNYDWAGVCCGCKEWVVPGFCIARNKVDEVV